MLKKNFKDLKENLCAVSADNKNSKERSIVYKAFLFANIEIGWVQCLFNSRIISVKLTTTHFYD